jgi:hypothetical protein
MAGLPPCLSLRLLRFLTALLALVLAFLAAEAAIRTFPGLLNEKTRHAAFSRYDTLPGGIFVVEGITGARFMRADFATRAYSAGRSWSHRTDGRGFRNPPGISNPEVVLLGDSSIYGHGVEATETVSHFLHADHGLVAFDMSAQGCCPYEHYLSLRLWNEELHPPTALLFVYVNDVRDLVKLGRTAWLPEPPEIGRFDFGEIRARVDTLIHHREPWILRATFASDLVRMFARSRGWRPEPPAESVTSKRWRPPKDALGASPREVSVPAAVLDDSIFRPVEKYINLLVDDLAARCGRASTRLVIVHLVPPVETAWPARDQAQAKLLESLRGVCIRHGLELVDTAGFFEGHTEWILSVDGHLNPAGHRALAAFLADTALDPK